MLLQLKRQLLTGWSLTWQVGSLLRAGSLLGNRVPIVGKPLSMVLDRLVLVVFALDGSSRNIFVKDLRIPHPTGVLLGGNGIRSSGRVLVNSGVKFVGRSPTDPAYLERHEAREVFRLGDKVMIGANSVLVGPLSICDDVVIGAMSLVTADITRPGVYVGSPVRRIAGSASDAWF